MQNFPVNGDFALRFAKGIFLPFTKLFPGEIMVSSGMVKIDILAE